MTRLGGLISRFAKADFGNAKNSLEVINKLYTSARGAVPSLGNVPRAFLPKGVSPSSPFPLPYQRVPSLERKGKRREQSRRKAASARMLNLVIMCLNGLVMDNYSFGTYGRYMPSRLQNRFITNLKNTVDSFVDDSLLWAPRERGDSHGLEEGFYAPVQSSKAEPILDSRLDLPVDGAACDMRKLAEKLELTEVLDWIDHPPLKEMLYEDLPASSLMATDWHKVLDRATEAGLLDWKPIDEVYSIPDQSGNLQPVINGSFAVPKSVELGSNEVPRQRWIANLTRSNLCFNKSALPDILLPTIRELLSVRLKPNDTLRCSKSDVKNAFFNFSTSQLAKYFCLTPPQKGSCASDPSTSQVTFVPTLKVMPMGWCGSVSLIQMLMSQLILHPTLGVKNVSNECSLNNPGRDRSLIESGEVYSGTVLDDFFVVSGQGLKASALHHQIMFDLRSVWSSNDIPRHDKKEFIYEKDLEIVGIRMRGVHAERHAVRRFEAMFEGLQLLGRFSTRRAERATVQGKIVNSSLLARPLLSIWEDWSSYEVGPPVMKWTESSWVEMLMAIVLNSLARCDLSRQFSSRVYATDACHERDNSVAGIGVAYAHFRASEFEEPAVALLSARGWCKTDLDDYLGQVENISVIDSSEVDPEVCMNTARGDKVRLIEHFDVETLHRNRHWAEVMSTSYSSEAHINYHEMLAALEAVKHRCRGEVNTVGLQLIDSSAALGGLLKGRSSSTMLNRLLRQVAVWSLCANIRLVYSYVASKNNIIADELSRRPFAH